MCKRSEPVRVRRSKYPSLLIIIISSWRQWPDIVYSPDRTTSPSRGARAVFLPRCRNHTATDSAVCHDYFTHRLYGFCSVGGDDDDDDDDDDNDDSDDENVTTSISPQTTAATKSSSSSSSSSFSSSSTSSLSLLPLAPLLCCCCWVCWCCCCCFDLFVVCLFVSFLSGGSFI